jgi:putative transcriptional regulator
MKNDPSNFFITRFFLNIFREKSNLLDLNFDTRLLPEAGLLLLSEPFLDNEYFTRSVILLCEHNGKGSFGFVLNNFLEENFEGLPDYILESNPRISIGGPVEVSHLYFIHSYGEKVPGSSELVNGLFLGGDFEILKSLLLAEDQPEKCVRYFLGYSGWDAQQLNDEIKEKSWVVCRPENNTWIMNTENDNLWEDSLKSLGAKYEMFSKFPVNPNNN